MPEVDEASVTLLLQSS